MKLTVVLNADASGLVGTLRVGEAELRKLGGQLDQTAVRSGRVGDGFGRIQSGAAGLFNSLTSLRSILAGLGLTYAVTQATALADTYTNIASKIRNVTRSEAELAHTRQRLFVLSHDTRQQMESTTDLYTRLTRATEDLRLSEEQRLRITETINKSMVVSGATVQESTAAIIQLSQGLAAGVLRGQEFNSVAEQAPVLLALIGKHLNMTTGELREFSRQGGLTSEVITKALLEGGEEIDRQFGNITLTVKGAATQFKNAVMMYVGATSEARGASEKLAVTISWLAENFPMLANGAIALAKAVALIYTTRLLAMAAAYTAELAKQVVLKLAAASAAAEMGIKTQAGMAASLKSIGLVNAALGSLGAWLAGWQIGTYLREQFLEVERFGIAMVAGLLKAWERLKTLGVGAWEAIKAAAQGAVNAIRTAVANILGALATVNEATDPFGIKSGITDKLREMEQQLRPTTSAWDKLKTTWAQLRGEMEKNEQAIDDQIFELWEYAKTQREAAAEAGQLSEEVGDQTELFSELVDVSGDATDGMYDFSAATREAARAADEAYRAEANLIRLIEDQASQLGGPAAGAALRYQRELAGIAEMEAAIMALGPMTIEQTEAVALARSQAADLYQRDLDGMDTETQRVAERAARAWEDFTGGLADAILDGSKGVKRWWKAMLDDMKRQLIQSGLLRLFGSLFNTGGAQSGGVMSMFGSMMGGGGIMGGAAGGAGGGIMSAGSWVQAGQNLWSGFGQGMQAMPMVQSLLGGLSNIGALGNLISYNGASMAAINAGMGAGGVGPSSALAGSGSTSGFGLTGAGAGVAAMAAWFAAAIIGNLEMWNRGWRPDGESLTLPNGQSVHGGGRGSATDSFGSMLGAGGIIVTRVAESILGSLGFSDKWASVLSGGSLVTRMFGRKAPELRQAEANYMFSGSGGLSGNERYFTHEQGGLFRSSRQTWHEFDQTGEVLEAGQAMWAQLLQTMTAAAAQMGSEVPDSFAASFRHWQQLSGKTGEVEAEKFIVEMLGRTWEEATADAAIIRLNAEALIATIDAALGTTVQQAIGQALPGPIVGGVGDALDRVGRMIDAQIEDSIGGMGWAGPATGGAGGTMGEASAIAERWRHDAELLAAGAQFLLAAATDIRRGVGLLGEEGGLTAITALIEDLQGPSESLVDTYVRVATSAALLDQALALSGVQIDGTREHIVRLATAITDAAGGLEQATALWNSYFSNFYSAAELAAFQSQQLRTAAEAAFSAAGLNLDDYTHDLAAFRAAFEAALPTLSAEEIANWLAAADALAAVTATARAIDASIEDGAWQQYLDGLTDSQRAIAETTRYYDDWRDSLIAAGATAEQLAAAEEQRAVAMERLLAAQVTSIIDTWITPFADAAVEMHQAIADMGLSAYAREQAQIAREAQQALAEAAAAGATPVELLAIEIAGLERAAAAAALAAANFASELADWEFEDYLAGLSEADAQRARVDRQWEQRYLRAIEIFGEGSEEAIRVLGLWDNAVARLGDNTAAAVDRMQRATMQMGDILEGIKTWAEKLNESIAHLRPGKEMDSWISELSGLPTLAQKAVRRPLAEVVQLVRDEYLAKAAELQQQLDAAWAQYEALPWHAQAEMHTLQGQIAALEQAMGSITGQMGSALDTLKRMYIASLQGVRDYLDSMLLGDLSALTPAEKLAEAWSQLQAAVEAGEGDAATRLADTYLRLLREFEASGDDYNTGFYAVRELLEGMFDIDWDALLGPDGGAASDSDNIAHMAGTVDAQLAAAQVANDWLAQIAANTGGGWGLPSYDVGTYNVPATGPAILHAGEMVLPRPMADAMRQGAFGGGDTQALETRLDAVIARLDRIDKTTAQGAQAVSQTIVTTGATSDRNADASRARHAQAQRRGVTA